LNVIFYFNIKYLLLDQTGNSLLHSLGNSYFLSVVVVVVVAAAVIVVVAVVVVVSIRTFTYNFNALSIYVVSTNVYTCNCQERPVLVYISIALKGGILEIY